MCPDPYLSHADSSFWAYSLRFYDDPKTQEACLDAQNRLGADVNLILYVFFKAQKGFRLNRNALQQANENVISWRTEVIHPLRQIRRKLKAHRYNLPENNQKTVRIEVKNLELKSEKFQQEEESALLGEIKAKLESGELTVGELRDFLSGFPEERHADIESELGY